MKLPKELVDLQAFYDEWIATRHIVNKKRKHAVWWAMFYTWKEGGEWSDKGAT